MEGSEFFIGGGNLGGGDGGPGGGLGVPGDGFHCGGSGKPLLRRKPPP